jgi:hypothetical protein
MSLAKNRAATTLSCIRLRASSRCLGVICMATSSIRPVRPVVEFQDSTERCLNAVELASSGIRAGQSDRAEVAGLQRVEHLPRVAANDFGHLQEALVIKRQADVQPKRVPGVPGEERSELVQRKWWRRGGGGIG